MLIRPEQPSDVAAISALITEAFHTAPHNSGTEAMIVRGLRDAGALSVSLVAESHGKLVGHLALSPVTLSNTADHWYGLGPLAVLPDYQRQGIGAALVREGLAELAGKGASGCVVLGEPAYYRRFGFRHYPQLVFADVPAEYFLALTFSPAGETKGPAEALPAGRITYHDAFYLAAPEP